MLGWFIISGILFSLGGGWIFGMLAVGGMPESGEWGKKIICVVVSILVGFAIAGSLCLEEIGYEKAWNDGVCPQCGIEWRFTNADHERTTGTHYYYVCDNCGKIIEQDAQRG